MSAEFSSKTKPYQARVWRGGKIVTLGGFAHRLGGGAVHRANAGGADGCCKACSGAAADEGGGAAAGAGGGADAAQGRQHDGLYFGVHHSNAGSSKIYLRLHPLNFPAAARARARRWALRACSHTCRTACRSPSTSSSSHRCALVPPTPWWSTGWRSSASSTSSRALGGKQPPRGFGLLALQHALSLLDQP